MCVSILEESFSGNSLNFQRQILQPLLKYMLIFDQIKSLSSLILKEMGKS